MGLAGAALLPVLLPCNAADLIFPTVAAKAIQGLSAALDWLHSLIACQVLTPADCLKEPSGVTLSPIDHLVTVCRIPDNRLPRKAATKTDPTAHSTSSRCAAGQ